MKTWPRQDEATMLREFGPVGENQTQIALPYPMRLTWALNTSVHRLTCHKKVAASLEIIFLKALQRYGYTDLMKLGLDRFSGCLCVRPMRGSKRWSIHAWGAAVDLWDDRNTLKMDRSEAEFAKPDYLDFWKIVESEGWTSLGRARDFDWMHFQAPRL